MKKKGHIGVGILLLGAVQYVLPHKEYSLIDIILSFSMVILGSGLPDYDFLLKYLYKI